MSEEKKVVLTPQELANLLKGTVEETIKAAQGKTDDYNLASKPFTRKTEGEQEAEKRESLISKPKERESVDKKLIGFQLEHFLTSYIWILKRSRLMEFPSVSNWESRACPQVVSQY